VLQEGLQGIGIYFAGIGDDVGADVSLVVSLAHPLAA
jgi:hypothetical protein